MKFVIIAVVINYLAYSIELDDVRNYDIKSTMSIPLSIDFGGVNIENV